VLVDKALTSQALPMRAHLIDLNPSQPDIKEKDVKDFAETYIQAVAQRDFAEGEANSIKLFFSGVKNRALSIINRANRASMHSEAALMSVIHPVRSGVALTTLEEVQALFTVRFFRSYWIKPLTMTSWGIDDISIGVSKQCCFCCDALKEIIVAHNHNLKLNIPGTHANVVPWLPPQCFEASPTILSALRLRILEALYRYASSPASISSTHVASDFYLGSAPGWMDRLG
jgi:hypothetical protein